jgi:HAD domain in Swiss Army Knife RNA repair proteins
MIERKNSVLALDQPTPTLFVDYDGTLHRGRGLLDEQGNISLDTNEPPFEFAPLLSSMLEPYPNVEIVLTTSWLDRLPLEQVVSYLPPSLAKRVVGTTHGIKSRFSYLKDGTSRTYVIRSYVFGKRLSNWLALDDSVYGGRQHSTDFLDLFKHLVLLDLERGIGDAVAQQRIEEWLAGVSRDDPFQHHP